MAAIAKKKASDRDDERPAEIELWTKEQVAQRLQLSTRTLYRKWQEGEIPPPIRVGTRVVRWRSDVINDWIANDCPRVGD